VGIAAFSTSRPNFNEDVPCHDRSPVGFEAFQMLAAAVEGTPAVLTAESMDDLLLLGQSSFSNSGFHFGTLSYRLRGGSP
jgi:hypothetical protein